MTPGETAALETEFDEARAANDHEAMEKIGRVLYPEPGAVAPSPRIPPAPPTVPAPDLRPSVGANIIDVKALRAELAQPLLPSRRRAAIEAMLHDHYRALYADTAPAATAAIEPAPGQGVALVADDYAMAPGTPAQSSVTLPAEVPVDQRALDGFLATVTEVGLAPSWAQKFIDYDHATLDEAPDADGPVNPAALAVAKEVVQLLPVAVQRHIAARRHLERAVFCERVAEIGAPLLRRSLAARTDLRNRLLRADFARRSSGSTPATPATPSSHPPLRPGADVASRLRAAYPERGEL
jgi:hypothetical protein